MKKVMMLLRVLGVLHSVTPPSTSAIGSTCGFSGGNEELVQAEKCASVGEYPPLFQSKKTKQQRHHDATPSMHDGKVGPRVIHKFPPCNINSNTILLPSPDAWIPTHFTPAFFTPENAAVWASYHQMLLDYHPHYQVPNHGSADGYTNTNIEIPGPDGNILKFKYSELKDLLDELSVLESLIICGSVVEIETDETETVIKAPNDLKILI